MPTRVRGEVCVAVPDPWFELETYSLFNVPSPAVLSYFLNRILFGDAARGRDIPQRTYGGITHVVSYRLSRWSLKATRDRYSYSGQSPERHYSYLDVHESVDTRVCILPHRPCYVF